MSDKKQQDEVLAEKLGKILEDQKNESGKNYLIGVASILNRTVIDPAVIAGSIRMLDTQHKSLYDALPEGDVDAWALLEIIQKHLETLKLASDGLKQSIQPVEVMNGKAKATPLERLSAQEAEVVENEDKNA